MKYKSRLIIPTLLSTSLLASTMVASADEIDQEEKTYEQNLETHYEEENGKVDNLADDDADESDESEEVVEEEDTEESLESDEEAAPEDEESEVDEDVDELESTETAEEAPIEEDVQSEEETVENTASTSENETAAVQESEVTTEAVTEVPSKEESNLETEEETDITVESTDTTVEETTEENTDSTTVSESVEEPAQDVEEVTSETEETSEAVAEAPSQEGSNIEADEETATSYVDNANTSVDEATEGNTESTTDSEIEEAEETEETVEEDTSETAESEVTSEDVNEAPSQEESNTEAEEETSTPDVDNVNTSVDEATEENTESTTESVTEEAEETVEEDTSTTAESEEATYKFDSETLTNELENKSAEERAEFIEENANNIEADEETLKELTQAVEDEHGVEIDENQVFSTMSTMSMSQAITDINSYIAENNFEVAEIQYDIIDHLPKYAYESNIGWETENGKVGQPSGVVLHDVGNDNSTIHGEISYMSENWENAFVHAFVDADNIIQVANTDYLAYGAGPVSNEIHLQVELVRHDNQHDFAKSINNYADYIANLLYKYKLPAERADSSGNGTLWSHVEVSNILGGTASPDPYEYFQSHGYAYEDVISLIQGRYNNLYNKVTTPSIYMPTFEGDTSNLAGSITNQNRGIYESITDVKTADASNYLGEDVRVVRSEIYNYEEYYLLENVADGSTIGWMYAGDVATSALPETPVEDDEDTDNSGDGTSPEAPGEDDDDGNDNSGDDSTPEAPVEEEDDGTDNSGDGSTPETPVEDNDEGTDNSGDDSTPKVPVEDDDESKSADDSNEDTSTDENQRDDGSDDSSKVDSPSDSNDENGSDDESRNDSTEDNSSDDGAEDESEQPTNGDNESEDETEEVIGRDESTDIDDDNGETTDDVSSSLEDPETGVRVYSASDELVGKQLEVIVLNPSNAIDATHDLYDIHILNSDGSLYNLNNPVTVYLPANGYVSNLYYLGDIGETLEAISYRTDDDYVVFETSSFSQYAVVYGESNKENTIIPPTSEKHGGDSSDGTNTHSKVYTENVGQVDQAEASISTNEVKGNTQKDSNQEAETTDEHDEEVAVLPNTGVKEQGTTVFAALLAALGLGFLVRRRKSGEEKQ